MSVLATGDAELTQSIVADGTDSGHAYLELVPRNPRSAKVGVQIDDEALVTVYIGHHGTLVECFLNRSGRLKEMLSAYIDAVIHGGYEEWVKSTDSAADGVVGEIRAGTRTVCIRYNTLTPRGWAKRRWRRVTYVPYV